MSQHDIGLSLPNNLTGYVPITAISKIIGQKIEKLLNEGEDDDEIDEEEDNDVFDLKNYFYLGQYLRAYVLSTGGDDAGASSGKKKHIELSIDPKHANSGLAKSDLVVDAAVQASVLSVEDHGLVMDLGIEGAKVKGFMSSKEVDPKQEAASIREGSVFLCMVTGHTASGSVIKLSANLHSSGSIKKSHYLSAAPTINSFLPGVAAELLLTEVTPNGMAGKIMGMLDTTVDLVQSGANSGQRELTRKFHAGAKIKGRLVCTFPASEPFKIGFSILDHVLKFSAENLARGPASDAPAISAVLPEVEVVEVDPRLGVYVRIVTTKYLGFVHISKLSDGKVESISANEGRYRIGTVHEARVIGYSALDDLYLLSMESKVIDQPFLRIEDVTVGAVVRGKVQKILIGAAGPDGLIVSLADGITGLVPPMHFADTQLQFPEKKFREGMTVSARILSVNPDKRQIRLSLKKALLNSDAAIWREYNHIVAGSHSPGTIVNINPYGAVVQFYGSVRGFLPVSEMSEAYIKDPSQHFKLGQVVNVHALSVDAANGKLAVSCKDPATFNEAYRKAFQNVYAGLLVTGSVFEKSSDDVLLKLEESGLIARLDIRHTVDASPSRQASALSKIRVGQKINDLLVLNVHRAHRLINVTNRPSLKKAAKAGHLLRKFEDVHEGAEVTGFIRNITSNGVFVEFFDHLTGLVPSRLVDDENAAKPSFGLERTQTVSATVHSVDNDFHRFILSMKPSGATLVKPEEPEKSTKADSSVSNPVDDAITSMSDIVFGRTLDCKIMSVKMTQINVQLADNIHGRIDVSEVFDKWEDIEDPKHPLKKFQPRDVISARVLGLHDARNHKFLPISHRTGKYPVFELSIKPSFLAAANPGTLHLEQVHIGSTWVGFVNNVVDDYMWISLSPNIRGRLRFKDATDDWSLLANVEKNFPIGSALEVEVISVSTDKGHLDFSSRRGNLKDLALSDLSVGMVLPARVTKVTERQVIVQLSDAVVGVVNMIDMADDFSKTNPAVYHKNDVIRVCVIGVDMPNKKLSLSTRPSRVLSSSLPVEDPEIATLKQFHVNMICRGLVKKVADSGLFVALSRSVTAYVRISDLSDSYLKDWKDEFHVDQLVKGRITLVDPEEGKLQMSLRESVLDPNFKAPLLLRDLRPGQVVTGKVRKVEEFGAFIVVDRSANVSGLCHRSEMADKRIDDARTLYEEGETVKAKILKIDRDQEKISFGLKASYFGGADADSSDESNDGIGVVSDEEDSDEIIIDADSDVDDDDEEPEDEDDGFSGEELDDQREDDGNQAVEMSDGPSLGRGLGAAAGFDWSGNVDEASKTSESDLNDEEESATRKKKKHGKPEIQVDRTGELDARGPQSVADYERLLLGEPHSSLLWLQYMAFHIELGEVEKAREIAERAIRSIGIGEDTEKLNVWIALLNIENTYGSDDSLEETFKGACQYNDTQEVYERMISIFIQSGKNEVRTGAEVIPLLISLMLTVLQKADELFQTALKRKIFHQSPKFFINYATFLFDSMAAPDRGRALLARSLQSLPRQAHVEITSKFGQLEFRSPNGDIERGRTVFEGLLSSFPKRIDLWNVLLDLEIKYGGVEQVRRLFERVLGIRNVRKSGAGAYSAASDGSSRRVKPKQARFFFKKWLEYEEKLSNADGGRNERMVDDVKARAAEYVKALKE